MDKTTGTNGAKGNRGREPDAKRQCLDGECPQQEQLIAVDIETIGDFIEVPEGSDMKPSSLISIGMVRVNVKTGKVEASKRISLKEEEGHDFEPRCLEEFWNKEDPVGSGKRPLMKLLKEFRTEAKPPKQAMQEFADWMDEQEEKHPDIGVWGDCLSFDYGWLTVYMQRYLGRRSMLFRKGDKWRPIRDTGSYARGLTRWSGEPGKEMWARLARMIPDLPDEDIHNHDPVQDASYIGMHAAAMLRYSARNPLEV